MRALSSRPAPARRALRRPRHARRGGSVAEFAITLPVMVLMLLGTIEFGHFFSQYGQVIAAARDAARFGANQDTLTGARTFAQLAAREVLTDMGYPCGLSDTGCAIDANILQQDGINYVEVTLDVDYQELTGVVPRGGLSVIPTSFRARAVYPVVGM